MHDTASTFVHTKCIKNQDSWVFQFCVIPGLRGLSTAPIPKAERAAVVVWWYWLLTTDISSPSFLLCNGLRYVRSLHAREYSSELEFAALISNNLWRRPATLLPCRHCPVYRPIDHRAQVILFCWNLLCLLIYAECYTIILIIYSTFTSAILTFTAVTHEPTWRPTWSGSVRSSHQTVSD